MAFKESHLLSIIDVAMKNGASDIHIRSGEPPSLRIRGDLIPVKSNKNIEAEDVFDICRIIFHSPEQIENVEKIKDLDGVYEASDMCRVRFNYFKYNGKPGMVLRLVQMKVPSIDELGLSTSLKKIVRQKRGLVLVTGATGSGKSTTLASMIDYVNEKQSRHIVTIEDPIEYLHPQKRSRITQREVGTDTDSYKSGLISALRQDPDIILLGELRDQESITTAMKAAETGHLVLATVHTTDAIQTVGRIIAMFPPEEQPEVRKRLAESLFATISQRMIKGQNKKIVIAQEVMVTTPGVKECIRGEEPLERLISIMTKGSDNDTGIISQTFDGHILKLFKKGIITEEEAEAHVSSAADFIQKVNFE